MYIYNLFVSLWIVVVVSIVLYLCVVVGTYWVSNYIYGYKKDKYIGWTIALPLTLLSYLIIGVYKVVTFPKTHRNKRLMEETFGLIKDISPTIENQKIVSDGMTYLATIFHLDCEHQELLRNQGDLELATNFQRVINDSKKKYWAAWDLAKNNKFAVPVTHSELLAR